MAASSKAYTSRAWPGICPKGFSTISAAWPGVRLVVGLTPAPRSFVGPDHEATCAHILEQWATWLKADAVFAGLPASMPDELFASVTHLTGEGQTLFTQRLAAELQTAAMARASRPGSIP